jgi:dTDP-L-rhamnose 4-epimerase
MRRRDLDTIHCPFSVQSTSEKQLTDTTKILVTGGAGFIGRRVTERLQSADQWVRWLDNLDPQVHGAEAAENPDYCRPANEMVLGDVRSRDDWKSALDGIDAVIHLAAQTGTAQSMYRVAGYTEVNVGGTALLWDILSNERTAVKRVIVASSRAVYGEGAYRCQGVCGLVVPDPRSKSQLQRGEWELLCPICGGEARPVATPEGSDGHPASVYACTKLAQESISLTMGRALGVGTVVLRLQNVYGPGQSLRNPYTGIISIFSNQMRQNFPVNIYEDGCESRDFVYIDDVADVCALALTLTDSPVLVNVGSGYPTRLIDLARTLRDTWGSTSPITVTGDYRVGDIRHNWSDNKLLKKYLTVWEPTPLKAGLEKFVDWAKTEAEFADHSQIAADELTTRDLGYQRTAAPQ